MPAVRTEGIMSHSATRHTCSRSSSDNGSSPLPSRLHGITESELRAWRRAVKDQSKLGHKFRYLEEPFDYPFKHHDSVWIFFRDDGQWCLGKVAGRNICMGQTSHSSRGFHYPVVFSNNQQQLRRYFSPINGEIKPDNYDVRELLRRGGWLPDPEDADDDDNENDAETSSDDSGSNYTDP